MKSSAQGRQDQPPVWLLLSEAEILNRRGAFDEARTVVNHPLLVDVFRGGYYEALQILSRILADSGRWEDAPLLIERMRAHAEEGEFIALPYFTDRLEGQAALASGDADGAVELLTSSSEGLADLSARWEAASVDLSLSQALAASGHEEAAAARLDQASKVFEELGSIRERDRARELLDRGA